MNRFTKKQTLTFLLPAVMLMAAPLRMEAQKKSAINPFNRQDSAKRRMEKHTHKYRGNF